jgi:hypothetical protein
MSSNNVMMSNNSIMQIATMQHNDLDVNNLEQKNMHVTNSEPTQMQSGAMHHHMMENNLLQASDMPSDTQNSIMQSTTAATPPEMTPELILSEPKKKRISSKMALSKENQIIMFVDKVRRQVCAKFDRPDCQLQHVGKNVTITCWQCEKMIKIATGNLHLRSLKSHLERCKADAGRKGMKPFGQVPSQADTTEIEGQHNHGNNDLRKRRVSSKAALSDANRVTMFRERVRSQVIKKFNVPNVRTL